MEGHPLIAISVSSFGTQSPEPDYLLDKAKVKVKRHSYGRRLTTDELVKLASNADGLIAGTEKLDAAVLAQLPNLQVISRVGVGLENIDLETAKTRGIKVCNTPDAVTDAVAELTIGGILCLLRGITTMDQALHQGTWQRHMGRLFSQTTIGIIGYGRIGQQVAQLSKAFGAKVIATDPFYKANAPLPHNAEHVQIEELLSAADIVTLHCSGSQETVIGAKEIAMMRSSAFLVNTARGNLVDEKALREALELNKISGAYIDTFAEEPYRGTLQSVNNLVMTAHAGSYAREARVKMEIQATQNLLKELEVS